MMSARFGPNGPTKPEGDPALVTDDTQMALAVGEALALAARPFTPETLEGPLREAFVAWADSPDNDRAPGMTCLTACGRLKMGMVWTKATVANSKGCGANMRVAPAGLLTGISGETRAAIAQFQAALTHGHPTGLTASDLTAWTVADLLSGGDPRALPRRLRDYARSQRTIYHADWLGPLWQQPLMETPEQFIARLGRVFGHSDDAGCRAGTRRPGGGPVPDYRGRVGGGRSVRDRAAVLSAVSRRSRCRPAPRRRQLRRLRFHRLPGWRVCRGLSWPDRLAGGLGAPDRIPRPSGVPGSGYHFLTASSLRLHRHLQGFLGGLLDLAFAQRDGFLQRGFGL